jgi:hypothetical protein
LWRRDETHIVLQMLSEVIISVLCLIDDQYWPELTGFNQYWPLSLQVLTGCMPIFSCIKVNNFKISMYRVKIWFNPPFRVITVFTVFRLLTDFVCLYTYEFWLSLCKIVRSSVILLLPLFSVMRADIFINISYKGAKFFLFFIFFVRFIKVPNFRILQFLKYFLSI